MDNVYLQHFCFRLHADLPNPNRKIPRKSNVLTNPPLDQHRSHPYPALPQTLRERLRIRPRRLRHRNIHLLSLLLHLLSHALQTDRKPPGTDHKVRGILFRVCNLLFAFFALATIVLIVLVLSSVVAKNCDNDLVEVGIAGFITELVSFVPTLYFGMDILRSMTKKH